MTGALFNSERRQTPFLVELDGLVMRPLLALPRNEASLAGKNLCFPGKFQAPSGTSELEMSCLERRGVCRLEAAVKSFLLTITGTLLCAAAPQSVSADSAVPLQTERNGQLRATRTSMPDIIDMSYADPAMWHRLPRTAPVYDESLSHAPAFEDLKFVNSLRPWL